LVIVGAGAAGLWAAGTARALGCAPLILEKTARAGTKILASGGTRCNLTTTLGADASARLFGPAERFLQPALRALPPARIREVFHGLGVPTVEEPALEKVFPASQRARDVRDALLQRAAGSTLRTHARVTGVEPCAEGWRVLLGDEEVVTTARLMICAGGASYPATGTTGDGYGWLRALGLEVRPVVPALVPLVSDADWVRDLAGISVQDGEARLLDPAGRVLGRRSRPVLFTHTGVSGPGAMDLSGLVAREARFGPLRGYNLALDLWPERGQEPLLSALAEAAQRGETLRAWLSPRGLPARLQAAVARQARLGSESPRLATLDARTARRLVEAVKGLRIPVTTTLGMDKAEVCAGGLALTEVSRATLAVRKHPKLWVFGELLDLDGPIGGLNFTAAFATADLAVRDALRA
jgi:hypothetical protein